VRAIVRSAADTVLASGPVTVVAHAATKQKLRVLAYHGVDDPAGFEWQLGYLREHYTVVSSDDVVAAVRGERSLPAMAVWVTFDDGIPSVIEYGLPLMERHGIRATMFICPGVVDTTAPMWWQAIETVFDRHLAREALGFLGNRSQPEVITAMKAMTTGELVDFVSTAGKVFEQHSERAWTTPQVRSEQLRRFLETGGTIGNHTYDHYLLDRCVASEAADQIRLGHDWLTHFMGTKPTLFAYPNGNHSPESEAELRSLGYVVAVLFDHRLAVIGTNPLQMSRLRVSDRNSRNRFAGILAGAHPFVARARALIVRRS